MSDLIKAVLWSAVDRAVKGVPGCQTDGKAKPMSYADIREAKERFKANSKLPIEAYCTKCGRVDRVYVLGDGSRVTSHVCSSCR